MNPQATAGRIVHYTVSKGQVRAAIVMADTGPDGTGSVMVQFDQGPAPLHGVPYAEEPTPGCWNWMPYQHAKAKTERGNESESAEGPEGASPPGPPDVSHETLAAGDAGPMAAGDEMPATPKAPRGRTLGRRRAPAGEEDTP